MKKQPDITATLDLFRAREGNSFQMDEAAVLADYEKANANRSGIAIKVLTVIGGFLATCAFMGFLFVGGLFESEMALCVTGFFFIAGALILKRVKDLLILDTFAVSFYVCGCVLLVIGANELHMNEITVSLLFMGIALFSLWFVQSYMMAFTATILFHTACVALLETYRYDSFVHIYISLLIWFFTLMILQEARIIRSSKLMNRLYNPVRMATLFALLTILYLSGSGWFFRIASFRWFTTFSAAAAILLLLPRILQKLEVKNITQQALAFAAAILVLAPTIWAPNIATAILIILASFLVNYKTGIVAGILALIWFVSEYYYSLHYTLLVKSLLMMATGVCFLLLYFITHKKLMPE